MSVTSKRLKPAHKNGTEVIEISADGKVIRATVTTNTHGVGWDDENISGGNLYICMIVYPHSVASEIMEMRANASDGGHALIMCATPKVKSLVMSALGFQHDVLSA